MVDRVIVYDSALPQTTDILNTNKFDLIGQAFLARAILGGSGSTPPAPFVHGLACNPTAPASLQVTVGAGSIYAMDEVDATAYGDLGVDATIVLKQGILYAPVTLTITPPSTSGFSQVFLVQVILSDIDTNSEVLSYFNASNPSQPFSGPGNSGQPNFTVRSTVCSVALKAGVAAPTNSQTTPAPDLGFTGLYAITVANAQSTITSGNIVTLSTAPFFPTLPAVPVDVQNNVWIYATDTSVGGAAIATNATTAASSSVLHFASVPSWVTVGMSAFDLTTPAAIAGGQTVLGKTSTAVTLSTTVSTTVSNADLIAFSSNAMVASVAPTPVALVPGLRVLIQSAGTNSGAPTLNLNGLGGVNIKRANGASAQAGDITVGMIADLIYDGTNFQIVNFEGFSGSTNNNTFNINIPYAVDTGSVNAIAATFSPPIVSLSAGQTIEVKIANTNTGPTTIAVNVLSAVPVIDNTGNALCANALVAGQIALMIYDGTSFQVVPRERSLGFGNFFGLNGSSTGSKTATFTIKQISANDSLGGSIFPGVNQSLSFNGATTGANGMDTGSTPVSADISIYAIHNPSTNSWATLGCRGATSRGTVYSGLNMPAGYVASQLIHASVTTNQGIFKSFVQVDRKIAIELTSVLNAGAALSYTAINCAATLPVAARWCWGEVDTGNVNPPGANGVVIASTASGHGSQEVSYNGSINGIIATWGPMILSVSQTLYYFNIVGSQIQGFIAVSGYEI